MDRRTLYAGLLGLLGLLVVVGALTGAISATEQVTNESASTFTVGSDEIDLLGAGLIVLPQGWMFAFFLLVTFGSVIGIGGGLLFLFRFLNYQVVASAAEENQPMNPLSYDAYGHAAGVGMVIAFTLLLLGVIFRVDAFAPGVNIGIVSDFASVESLVARDGLVFEGLVISLLFGLVAGLFVHFLIYYRVREGEEHLDGKFIHGNMRLEIAWIIVPTVFVLLVAVVAAFAHENISEAKDGEIPVGVTAQQWSWSFTYPIEVIPEDIRPEGVESFSSSELVVLVNQPLVLEMNSVDVIHSFWVPEMYVKRDIAPGIQTEVRFIPTTETGYNFENQPDFFRYKVQCAELCGTLHSQMLADVYVVNEADYRAWLERKVLPAFGNPVLAGEILYETNCETCHSNDGATDKLGPTWLGLYGAERSLEGGGTVLVDQAYLTTSIINPNADIAEGYTTGVMLQNFGTDLSATEITQLTYYIMSLSEAGCAELPGILPDADVDSPAELCSIDLAGASE